jgi:competence protein ComEC
MTSKRFKIILFLGTILAIIFFWPNDNLQVTFCDVGQGDAILISHHHFQILIDGGPDNKVLECLSDNLPFWDRKIEMIILTHSENDHFNGLISVIERYRLSYFVWGGISRESSGFQKLLAQIGNQGATVIKVTQNDEITIGKIKIKVYWPEAKWVDQQLSANQEKIVFNNHSNTSYLDQFDTTITTIKNGVDFPFNNFSLVLDVSFEDFNILLMGDADSKIQPQILKTTALKAAEIIKIPHHGSKYAFTNDFFHFFTADQAVISVGENSWGHPNAELLEQLNQNNIPYWRTDQQKNILVKSDGKIWWRK